MVVVFGGSFNPPHVAHVLALSWVLSTQEVDEILVIPTYQHPFAKTLAPYADRVEMCTLAMGWLPRVSVSRLEETLGGESRTLRTLEHLAAEHPAWKMRLLMGSDLLLEADKWFRFDRVRELAPPLVVGRRGVDAPGAPRALLPQVSSTEVRAAIARGARGDWDELSLVVPRDVLSYVKEHSLYRG